ncbi:glycerophosphodiester phosphodiesterase [Namhaeicola litoreus]|uniref:Glycerophosphodiester phosphodiesterase n=1 Tax=Namhaeicola litoreus TaxID=1052145 RepID=A0ABW3Y1M3_9FLAO
MILLIMLLTHTFSQSQYKIDLQGHRGCRGLMPENTIAAFIKALEIGVTTLEMDIALSKDLQVVVSHEPYFSHNIATDPNGEFITRNTEKQYNLYLLTYEDIVKYDVGLKPHPHFPEQEKIPAVKPLLQQVVEEVESFTKTRQSKKPLYSIEIKRNPKWDGIFHPPVQEFVQLVLEQIKILHIEERTTIQSFDHETLQIIRKLAPEIPLALLVENVGSVEKNIKKLGFTPEIYSPYYRLVQAKSVRYCKENNLQIIPWTVNKEKDILSMIKLGVDGMISDYPDRVKKIVDQQHITIQ